jgi:hypothetical protein
MITYHSNSVNIQLPSTSFVDKVLKSNSYEELHWLFLHANSPSKEISESYAAFHTLIDNKIKVTSNVFLHVGDGGYARTAAIFTLYGGA